MGDRPAGDDHDDVSAQALLLRNEVGPMRQELDRKLLAAGAAVGLILTVAGAAGSHLLYQPLTSEGLEETQRLLERIETISTWNTAMIFGWAHTIASLWTAGGTSTVSRRFRPAGWLFLIGVALFSGGIIVRAILETSLPALALPTWLTPLGGAAFISGWLFVLVVGIREGRRPQPRV